MVNKKADRARQFLPFDALKGYRQAIANKNKIIISKKELSEDDAENLSYKFKQLKVGKMVKIIYFDGKDYISIEGMLSKISLDEKYIKIVKEKILIQDIINISGDNIDEL